ncbi:MAG: hypothetical protein HQL12_04360 [Candidatus Omnitrophica bacterium]|nr:hypothetical protein [Candidatus Omnitrophota bacterium]
MKIVYTCLVVLFLINASVFAQDQSVSAGDIVSRIQSKLNLTQDQVAAVSPIIEKYSSKRRELWQSVKDKTADKESIHSQMKQLKEDEKQELSQVLSDDQLNQWEQMQGQGRHKHNGTGNGSGDNAPEQ